MGDYGFSMRAIFLLLVMATSNLLLLPLATAQDTAMELIRQMIAIASENGGIGHEDELNALKQKIDALPKPERGNRSAAQKENEKGLAAISAKDYEQAKRYFLTAQQLDPRNPEIANNLGFVYLKLGDYQQAMKTLVETIKLSPGRANAWVNLGEYFAVREKTQHAVACYALTYHFSQNRDKTRLLFQEQSTAADDPKVRQAVQQALQLSLIQRGEESITRSLEDFLTAPKPPSEPATSPVAKAPVAVPAQPAVTPPAQASPPPEPAGKSEGVHACDRYAAHPADPTLPTQSGLGVSDEDLDAESAIKVCQSAAGEQPDVPRFKFQLGRALMKADRIEDAIELFVAAAEQGHGGALAYLGDLHLGGAPGIEADPVLARSLFEKAVEAGFTPAKTILNQFEDYTERFAQAERGEQIEESARTASSGQGDDGYHSSAIINAIYNQNYSAIPDDQDTRRYVASIVRALAENCGDRPANVALAIPRYASPEYREAEKDPANPLKLFGLLNIKPMYRTDGLQDGNLFINTYSCQGKESSTFQNNIHKLVVERSFKGPAQRTDGLSDNLEQACLIALGNRPAHSRSPERLRRQYCSCAAPRLEGSLTSAERNMLLRDFDQLGRLMQQQRRDLLSYVGQCNI